MSSPYEELTHEELVELLSARDTNLQELERYRVLVEQAADGIFVANADGIYLDVNSTGARMLSATCDDLVGRHMSEIVAPDEAGNIADDITSLKARGFLVVERTFRRLDGSFFPGEVSATVLPDGRMQGILRDISSRKADEANLRQREEQMRVIFENSLDAVVTMTAEGAISSWNPRAESIFGWEMKEVLGRRMSEVILPERDREPHEQGLKQRFIRQVCTWIGEDPGA